MYCKDCGNELKENARFCSRCGAQVESVGAKPIASASLADVKALRGFDPTRMLIIVLILLATNIFTMAAPFLNILKPNYNYDMNSETIRLIHEITEPFSFFELSSKKLLGDQSREDSHYDMAAIVVLVILVIQVILTIVCIYKTINGKNLSPKGFANVTKLLLFISLGVVVQFSFITVSVWSSTFLTVNWTGLYYAYLIIALADFFVEIGFYNILKKQEQ
ncbi:MAG: zinc ribbon domain-containing protein [Ruminococcus sp.]|nr:zinc ribbon domain-containing protein [Ruminococcus sp.]